MSLVKCPICKSKVSNMADACPVCGFKISGTPHCPECNSAISENDSVCPSCGFPLEKVGASTFTDVSNVAFNDVKSLSYNSDRKRSKKKVIIAIAAVAAILIAIICAISLSTSNKSMERAVYGEWETYKFVSDSGTIIYYDELPYSYKDDLYMSIEFYSDGTCEFFADDYVDLEWEISSDGTITLNGEVKMKYDVDSDEIVINTDDTVFYLERE